MSSQGKTTISLSLVFALTIGWLTFWYYQQQSVQAQINDVSNDVASMSATLPGINNRLVRIEDKVDILLSEHK